MSRQNNSSNPASLNGLGTSDAGDTADVWVGDEVRRNRLCRAFECATGWKIQNKQSAGGPSPNARNGQVAESNFASLSDQTSSAAVLEPSMARPPVSQSQAELLASEISWLLRELDSTRRTVWQREAELATGVPVRRRLDEDSHLAARLEAILKGGAEAVACQSAGIYLLDDATSELKLRACWGMPRNKLMEKARPLRGAIADLEALLGHAVVIEQTSMLPHWRVPERCASAACVPISSPTEPLGTLWMFCNQPRDFTSSQTNLIEIIAGRVASELQRDMLLTECTQTRSVEHQLAAAAQWQRVREPSVISLVDDWEMAGFSSSGDYPGGSFFDWWVSTDGHVTLAAGSGGENSLRGGMTAAELRGMLRAVTAQNFDCESSLRQLHEIMRDATPKSPEVSLGLVRVASESGIVDFSTTGHVACWHFAEGAWRNISGASAEGSKPLVITPSDSFVFTAFDAHDEGEAEKIGHLVSEKLRPDRRAWQEQSASLRELLLERLPGFHGSLAALRRR